MRTAQQHEEHSKENYVTNEPSSSSSAVVSPDRELPRFTLFNKLPVELRHIIWHFALPGPRAIHVRLSGSRGHGFVIASELAQAKVKVATSIPGVLHAVRDSRAIALKHYSIAFEHHPKVQTMFFNYDLDYLHISPPLLESLFDGHAMSVIREQTLCKVRNLIIDPPCRLQHAGLDAMQARFFRSLKHVIIPHIFPLGDPRRVRKENTGREYFKQDRCVENMSLGGMDVEYKTIVELRELSRALRSYSPI